MGIVLGALVNVAGLLAQAAAPAEQPPLWTMAPPLIAALALGYLIILRPQQREQQKRQSLISSLKKNDKVETIGGILGTVASVSPDGKEVTLKLDENTRVRFTAQSIVRVESATAKTETVEKAVT